MERRRRSSLECPGIALGLACAVFLASCGGSGAVERSVPASYESHEDILMAMEEGGYVCDAVDVSVRDREGQDLVDSRQPPDLSAEDREMWDEGMIDEEAKARSSGMKGWATCWWRDDRLDVMVFDSEQSRLSMQVGAIGFGCFALPGGRMQIPYVHGDDWAILPGWAETPFEDIEGIAHAVGGQAVNTRCADLSAAVESWEGSYGDVDAAPIDALRVALGEQE